MKSKFIVVLSIVVLVLSIITGGVFYNRSLYEEVHPRKGNIVEAIYGLGKVKSDKRFEVTVGILTEVENLYVKEGDSVTKGSPLIKFKDSRVFKSPIEGKVTTISHYERETVLPHQPVIKVENIQNRHIEVSLEQSAALRVKKDQEAKVLFESLRNQKYMGKVTSLFPRDDEFIAHIDVSNLPENVLPGMTADVAIIVGSKEGATLIPLSAISNGKITLKNDGERRKKIAIEIGTIDGQFAEVLTPQLSESNKVLVRKNKK